ncbi:unnamed protein product, partial [Ectocarpus sp. 13 AM-2016]
SDRAGDRVRHRVRRLRPRPRACPSLLPGEAPRYPPQARAVPGRRRTLQRGGDGVLAGREAARGHRHVRAPEGLGRRVPRCRGPRPARRVRRAVRPSRRRGGGGGSSRGGGLIRARRQAREGVTVLRRGRNVERCASGVPKASAA